jgi:hypothetical protein
MPLFDHADYIIKEFTEKEEVFVHYDALIYGVFANFLIIGLLVLFYKIKYLKFASFFITRMFIIISEIIPLILIISGTQIIFAYSFMIIFYINRDSSNVK